MPRRTYDAAMRDIELYQRILGLESPWKVARVDLDVKQTRVDVYAEHAKRKTWPRSQCPRCRNRPSGLGLQFRRYRLDRRDG
jgi:hypothetical protein